MFLFSLILRSYSGTKKSEEPKAATMNCNTDSSSPDQGIHYFYALSLLRLQNTVTEQAPTL
jgi:hypothetical protein